MRRLSLANSPLAVPSTRPPRAAAAARAPSACAECVRRKSEGQRREKKKKLIVFASRPTFQKNGDDIDDDSKRPSTSSSSSTSASTNDDPGAPRPGDPPPLRAALAALRFYRSSISPALPKSCRFLPSCSEYSQRSYRRFGVVRGTVLTAWRLLRCQPFNPSKEFYDPPRWPPIGLEWAFRGAEVEKE